MVGIGIETEGNELQTEQIEFIHNAEPIPAPRPRLGFRVFNQASYTVWKDDFALTLRVKYPDFQFNKTPLGMDVAFYRSTKRHCDIDNLLKSVMDALTSSRIIPDDHYIYAVTARKFYSRECPRTCLVLWEIP